MNFYLKVCVILREFINIISIRNIFYCIYIYMISYIYILYVYELYFYIINKKIEYVYIFELIIVLL